MRKLIFLLLLVCNVLQAKETQFYFVIPNKKIGNIYEKDVYIASQIGMAKPEYWTQIYYDTTSCTGTIKFPAKKVEYKFGEKSTSYWWILYFIVFYPIGYVDAKYSVSLKIRLLINKKMNKWRQK